MTIGVCKRRRGAERSSSRGERPVQHTSAAPSNFKTARTGADHGGAEHRPARDATTTTKHKQSTSAESPTRTGQRATSSSGHEDRRCEAAAATAKSPTNQEQSGPSRSPAPGRVASAAGVPHRPTGPEPADYGEK